MIRFEQIELSKISELRNEYLNSLVVFQELYLELMLPESSCYLIYENNFVIAGYAIVASQNILIEFYIFEQFIPWGQSYFSQIIKELNICNIYCKSFYATLLNFCLLNTFNYTILGNHYRDYTDKGIDLNEWIKVRPAEMLDIQFVMKQKDDIDELFETEEQLESFIRDESVFLFYLNDEFAGCGTILRVHPDWDYQDLGIWVKKEFRRQGVATHIINWSVSYCNSKKWIPICGCDIENFASQKTLEKCGFISKYKLINFIVK